MVLLVPVMRLRVMMRFWVMKVPAVTAARASPGAATARAGAAASTTAPPAAPAVVDGRARQGDQGLALRPIGVRPRTDPGHGADRRRVVAEGGEVGLVNGSDRGVERGGAVVVIDAVKLE